MISSKQRKLLAAFKDAINNPPRNFSAEAIDHLASEVHDLNKVLHKERIALTIRSSWIEEDMSFLIVLEKPNGLRQSEPLLKLQVTPLSYVKVQVIASIPSSDSIKQKVYYHMDKETCNGRFMDDIRGHVKAIIPKNLNNKMLCIFNGIDNNSDDYRNLKALINEAIPAKYAGTVDPYQAYVLAHYKPIRAFNRL